MDRLTHVDLCSGIGGFALAAEENGVETVAFAEIDRYASRVLASRWAHVTNYGDVRRVPHFPCWLITAGFPCQPFSNCGAQRGVADDRYIWASIAANVERCRPTWFLGENVPSLRRLALDEVAADLESLGYTVWPCCVPACAVDAPHIRERLWILAHANKSGRGQTPTGRQSGQPVGDTWHPWADQPDMGRVVYGLSGWTLAVGALGNAIVPKVASRFIGWMKQADPSW